MGTYMTLFKHTSLKKTVGNSKGISTFSLAITLSLFLTTTFILANNFQIISVQLKLLKEQVMTKDNEKTCETKETTYGETLTTCKNENEMVSLFLSP